MLIWQASGAAAAIKPAIVAGWAHTPALQKDGSLWAWGYNGYGQLGVGDLTDRHSPTHLTGSRWGHPISTNPGLYLLLLGN